MKKLRIALLSVALLPVALSSPPARASDPAPAPLAAELAAAEPVELLPPSAQAAFAFRDVINAKEAPGSFRRVRDAGGRPVFLATTPKGSTDQYAINASWKLPSPIAKGDAVLVRLVMRAISARQESGEAEGLIFVQGDGERDATQSFSVGPDWTRIDVPFVVSGDRAAGAEQLSIAFANLPQSIEIAGIKVLNFGKRTPLAALPVTRFTYAGREPTAAWRSAALARIDAIRTAPIAVKVVDRRGRPVRGAKVDLAMTRSEFLWGSAVSVGEIIRPGPDGDRYRKLVTELFDTTVIDNGLKWGSWRRSPEARRDALQAVDWLAAQGLRVKGHNLIWPAWKFTPKDIAADPDRGNKIGALATAHIREITAATKGRLIGWDVVNEPIHEEDYWKHLPRETVADWFKLARAEEPGLKLTLNEYGMLNRSSSPLMIGRMLDFTRLIEANGAKVDILGVQAHVGQTPRPPVAVLSDLDLLAAQGHEVQITEFDFNTRDEALQADYTRDFLIALYSHRAVTGFLQWGFWEKAHWKPDAAMFRADWTEKPNAEVWRDYVLGRWRTRLAATADADGAVRTRGHKGWYRVTASASGRTRTIEGWRISDTPGELTVRLD